MELENSFEALFTSRLNFLFVGLKYCDGFPRLSHGRKVREVSLVFQPQIKAPATAKLAIIPHGTISIAGAEIEWSTDFH